LGRRRPRIAPHLEAPRVTRDTTHEPQRLPWAAEADAPADHAAHPAVHRRGQHLRARLKQHPVRTAVAAVVVVGAGTLVGRVALRLTRGALRRLTGKDAAELVPSPERVPDPALE
jgi:hypothetical protein